MGFLSKDSIEDTIKLRDIQKDLDTKGRDIEKKQALYEMREKENQKVLLQFELKKHNLKKNLSEIIKEAEQKKKEISIIEEDKKLQERIVKKRKDELHELVSKLKEKEEQVRTKD